jgi:hypothetical protein
MPSACLSVWIENKKGMRHIAYSSVDSLLREPRPSAISENHLYSGRQRLYLSRTGHNTTQDYRLRARGLWHSRHVSCQSALLQQGQLSKKGDKIISSGTYESQVASGAASSVVIDCSWTTGLSVALLRYSSGDVVLYIQVMKYQYHTFTRWTKHT